MRAQKPGNVGTGMATEIISKIPDWGCNYMAMKYFSYCPLGCLQPKSCSRIAT